MRDSFSKTATWISPEEFLNIYCPIRKDELEPKYLGMLVPDTEEYRDIIVRFLDSDPCHLWTAVRELEGDLIVLSSRRLVVGRIGFVLSVTPFEEDEELLVDFSLLCNQHLSIRV